MNYYFSCMVLYHLPSLRQQIVMSVKMSNGNCSGEFVSWEEITAVLETFKMKWNLLKLSIKVFQLLTFRSSVNPSVNIEDFGVGICAIWAPSLKSFFEFEISHQTYARRQLQYFYCPSPTFSASQASTEVQQLSSMATRRHSCIANDCISGLSIWDCFV